MIKYHLMKPKILLLYFIPFNFNICNKYEILHLIPKDIINFIQNQHTNFMKDTDLNIIIKSLYNQYIKKNTEIQQILLKIKDVNIKNFLLFSILPQINYSFEEGFKKILDKNFLILNWNIIDILENILNNINNKEIQDIQYEFIKKKNEIILNYTELLIKLYNKISDFKSNLAILQYLYEEKINKYSDLNLLSNDEINNKYIIDEYILKYSLDLVKTFYELNQIIIESNFTFNQEYIYFLIHIYENKLEIINNNILNLQELNLINNSEDKIKIQKVYKTYNISEILHFKNFLEVPVELSIKNPQLSWDIITLKFNLVQFINHISSYFLNKKQFKLITEYDNNKWEELVKKNNINIQNTQTKYIFYINKLIYLYQILINYEALEKIKVKNKLKYYIDFIEIKYKLIALLLEIELMNKLLYCA